MGIMPIKPNKNFRLHIKNVPPVRDDDSLYVNIGYTHDADGYKSLEPRWFIGNYDTMVNVRITYDEKYWGIEYLYKDEKEGWHYYNGNPYCIPLDTCDIYIEF